MRHIAQLHSVTPEDEGGRAAGIKKSSSEFERSKKESFLRAIIGGRLRAAASKCTHDMNTLSMKEREGRRGFRRTK